MQAIIYQYPQQTIFVPDRPLPHLREDYILIRVKAVALNPTDWKHVEYDLPKCGCLLGIDYVGLVEEVGPKVTKSFLPGDPIVGFVHGGNQSQPEDGAFAEYIVAQGDLQAHVPAHLSWAQAATLGTGIMTVGQGLFEPGYGLGLRMPGALKDPPTTTGTGMPAKTGVQVPAEAILIYGGSTATGSLGIQFAKAAGYQVITTCSPRNFELVRQRGSDLVFDYHDPACGAIIKTATRDQLRYVWDCIGDDRSYEICAEALSSVPGTTRYSTIVYRDFTNARSDIEHSFTLGYVALGEDFEKFGHLFTGNEKHRDFQRRWLPTAWKLVEQGLVQPHPLRESQQGLKGVQEGLKTMKAGEYTGEKLVFLLGEE